MMADDVAALKEDVGNWSIEQVLPGWGKKKNIHTQRRSWMMQGRRFKTCRPDKTLAIM